MASVVVRLVLVLILSVWCYGLDVVNDCGAVGDGVTVDTVAVQKCLDAGSLNGDVVVFGASRVFLIGRVEIGSNTIIELEEDALVLGSIEPADYSLTDPNLWVLLHSVGQNNITIKGKGTIDGQAVPYFVSYWNPVELKLEAKTWEGTAGCSGECRPRLVQLEWCTNVAISGVRLQNSPDWTLHLLGSTNVTIYNMTILGDQRFPNNDGIDVDSSSNVIIENIVVDTGDDSVCIKSTSGYGPARNVFVRNCILRSRSAAIKFGSATYEDMYNMLFENIFIWDTNRGIGIQQRDAGNIYNITFRNITINGTRYWPLTWWGSAEPIYITSTARSKEDPDSGYTSNVLFENIQALAENGVLISGRLHRGGSAIYNVTFRNVGIHIGRYSNMSDPRHDYRPSYFPNIIPWDVDGFFCQNAEGVLFHNVTVEYLDPAQPFYGQCLNSLNSTDITKDQFVCLGEVQANPKKNK
ncbi:polygalacturonase ADPG2 [Pelomyxa schiedti]|nr:polygalacturonase ADPG2 [Pelomyxa schiedti]